MAEETTNASSSAPKGIIMTCVATALTGFTFLLGLLYASGCSNLDCIDLNLTGSTSEITISSQPVVNIFQKAFTKYDISGNVTSYQKGGALAMAIMILINLFFAGFSSMTVTTRIGFAMARDGAFPGSSCLYHVTKVNKVPNRMIILVFMIDALLVLLPL